jgi:hypothetical protein
MMPGEEPVKVSSGMAISHKRQNACEDPTLEPCQVTLVSFGKKKKKKKKKKKSHRCFFFFSHRTNAARPATLAAKCRVVVRAAHRLVACAARTRKCPALAFRALRATRAAATSACRLAPFAVRMCLVARIRDIAWPVRPARWRRRRARRAPRSSFRRRCLRCSPLFLLFKCDSNTKETAFCRGRFE